MSRFSVGCAVVLGFGLEAGAAQFATSAPQYTMGNVYTASGVMFNEPSAAVGAPGAIVGAGTAFAGVLSPFNAHYERDEHPQIGRAHV